MSCNNSSPNVIQPIYRVRYDDWSFVFKFLEADKITPIDITGWTFKFAIYKGSVQIVDFDSSGPEFTIDIPNAKVTVNVSHAFTDLSPNAQYTYFLQYKDALLKQHTPIKDAPLIVLANKPL